MTNWASATFSAAFDAVKGAASRLVGRKVRSTRFREKNGGTPFNASGVVRVAHQRFVFIDNNDPSALFEFELDSDGEGVQRIRRRPLTGLTDGLLRDPEGLCRVDVDGEILLVAASSLCVAGSGRSGRREVCDGLVRIRYRSAGDLPAEAMDGFRAWLLRQEPTLADSADRVPDDGGLNVEGLAWDPHANTLLFGLRGPADPGRIGIVRVPVDARVAPWATSSLGDPTAARVSVPNSTARQGVRDMSFDERTGGFLILLGRSSSRGDEPFQLCTWDGDGDSVELLDVRFHRSMKPEGIEPFSDGDKRKVIIVDDDGGYAVVRLQ
ncbi:MAG: hypothetical protein JWR11_1769 [Mycobacterium sp.]|nr:hypothetical protein [Mycobacterium sp.]